MKGVIMRELSIFNQLRPRVLGFNNFFDLWESDEFFSPQSNYPAYDVIQESPTKYSVRLALAGFKRSEISVSFSDGQLSIESVKSDKTKEKEADGKIVHQGIAKRYFKRTFSVAENCEIKDAQLKDGMLTISLEKKEAKKPRMIDIK